MKKEEINCLKCKWIFNKKGRIAHLIIHGIFYFILIFISVPVGAASNKSQSFQGWLHSFYPVAAKEGISRITYDRAFAGVTAPDREVLRKSAYQPEFTTEIWDYLDMRVNSRSIDKGHVLATVYSAILDEIEARFGVDSSVLLAIWSIESSYGAALKRPERLHYVPRALATLAYADDRRRKFARNQLIAALKILQADDITVEQLSGSWAGAMGHTQFIPTSYLAYGVDMDGDGHRDIWGSIPDALATAANLLKENGWRSGKAWGYEVRVPANGLRFEGKTRTLAQWQKLGFTRPGGDAFVESGEKAVLKMLGNDRGPGFLMLRNFYIFKRYNSSNFYALAVGLLSDRLAGKKGMVQDWPRPDGSLLFDEKLEIQRLLKDKGFYTGSIDGDPGSNTRKGIRLFQKSQGVSPDGEPTQTVLKALRR